MTGGGCSSAAHAMRFRDALCAGMRSIVPACRKWGGKHPRLSKLGSSRLLSGNLDNLSLLSAPPLMHLIACRYRSMNPCHWQEYESCLAAHPKVPGAKRIADKS